MVMLHSDDLTGSCKATYRDTIVFLPVIISNSFEYIPGDVKEKELLKIDGGLPATVWLSDNVRLL